MPKPRKHQISLDATPYYHCTSRCVRRAFLCGIDEHTGQNFEHRRQWVEDRILEVANAFCIDVCAYAVMSNHLHLVLHINASTAAALSKEDICHRWHTLFNGTPLTQRYIRGDELTKAELEAVYEKAETWRLQLQSISWFMRCVNEPIARMANAEDRCTGSFWESRFSSQALLDEKALAACLAYVDLNPVRAKMADTPEDSEYTSIKQRIQAITEEKYRPAPLFPFIGNPREDMPQGLPFEFKDYLALVDWTGRTLRNDKRGAISDALPPILDRLNFSSQQWLTLASQFEQKTRLLVGEQEIVNDYAHLFSYKRKPPSAELQTFFA